MRQLLHVLKVDLGCMSKENSVRLGMGIKVACVSLSLSVIIRKIEQPSFY